MPTEPPPEVWEAAHELYGKVNHIYINVARNATSAAQCRDPWCREVAEIITSHLSKHRRMVEGLMEVGR